MTLVGKAAGMTRKKLGEGLPTKQFSTPLAARVEFLVLVFEVRYIQMRVNLRRCQIRFRVFPPAANRAGGISCACS